jgi:GNAT superfamily N-acetyltransferase
MTITYEWRGAFTNDQFHRLHAEAFETRLFDDDWVSITERWSLGWVTAHDAGVLVGFVNVPWDGLVHAWLQDTMVAASQRGQGIATKLVTVAAQHSREAGCEWLHVDFDDELSPFYFDACRFRPTNAGLIALQDDA